MTTKFVNSTKAVLLFSFALLSIIACEKDFEDVGVTLIDNNLFSTKDSVFEVISYSKNVELSRVDGLPQHLLGVYNDPNFGTLNSAFVSQVGFSGTISFGLNPVIDKVILDIPYYSTRDSEDFSDGKPSFTLDSILGDQELEYELKVHRLATFLNTLNPLDPTQNKTYFSNENYSALTELYAGNFKPIRTDTVLYVERKFLDDDINTIDDTDTIKKSDSKPSIKLPLDNDKIKNIFIDNLSDSDAASFADFSAYFRGILIEAVGTDGALMTLPMSTATINIYYTNEILTTESGTDLNGNGTTNDVDVPVKTKQTMALTLTGIRASTYNRDYTTADVTSNVSTILSPPNTVDGEKELYVQGAAGSIAEFELFNGIDLDQIRSENWLINGAILDLYVVDKDNNRNVPERLYLYNSDENSTVLDVISEAAVNGIGGILERDDDNKPVKYQFSITDYISQVLRQDNPRAIAKLAIKTYHPFDVPQAFTDTIVKDFSWFPRGVVLKGNDLPLKVDGTKDETRFKLKIYYTVDND